MKAIVIWSFDFGDIKFKTNATLENGIITYEEVDNEPGNYLDELTLINEDGMIFECSLECQKGILINDVCMNPACESHNN